MRIPRKYTLQKIKLLVLRVGVPASTDPYLFSL